MSAGESEATQAEKPREPHGEKAHVPDLLSHHRHRAIVITRPGDGFVLRHFVDVCEILTRESDIAVSFAR